VRDVLVDLEYAIEQNTAIVEVEDLPTIEAEAIQMRQLFQNLIGNALKFRKSEEHPHIKIYARSMPRKSYNNLITGENLVKIFVEDNGIGFDEQYKDKIFQIFQRLEGRKYEGSGIGLAICKRIATRHGGDIDANSALDKGLPCISLSSTCPVNAPFSTALFCRSVISSAAN
jgi:two-component system sensor kinase FixL